MASLKWDSAGERFFETGVEQCALYVKDEDGYGVGVAWNGISQISESPEGGEPTPIYADNMKYLNLISAEDFKATIEAYTYPDEFAVCNGEAQLDGVTGVSFGQQGRVQFGLAYKTKIGNDEDGDALGYKIHLIYNCLASPSEKSYQTTNDSPEAVTFSWSISTTPVSFVNDDVKVKTAHVIIDSTKTDETKLAKLEAYLFGTDGSGSGSDTGTDPKLPLPGAIAGIMNAT